MENLPKFGSEGLAGTLLTIACTPEGAKLIFFLTPCKKLLYLGIGPIV